MRISSLLLLLAASAVSCASGQWPGWTDELVSSLDCGMTISEVESLAGQKTVPVKTAAFRGVYGTHTIDKGNVTVWLDFEEGELQAFSRWRVQPWQLKSIFISPKRNLCNGDLSFFIRLFRPAALGNPIVFLDGEEIVDFPWASPYEVSSGSHELRIVEEGYKPIIKHFSFAEGDPGESWLEITGDELQPVPADAGGSPTDPNEASLQTLKEGVAMRDTPRNVLVVTTSAVAASTALLPSMSGHRTLLSQAVVLGSWGVVAWLVSSRFADQHDGAVWGIAVLINALLFLVPALVIYSVARRERRRLGVSLILGWGLLYLAALFWLFGATDGP